MEDYCNRLCESLWSLFFRDFITVDMAEAVPNIPHRKVYNLIDCFVAIPQGISVIVGGTFMAEFSLGDAEFLICLLPRILYGNGTSFMGFPDSSVSMPTLQV